MVVEFGPEHNRPATKSSDIDDITPGRNLNLRISKLLYDGGVYVAKENRRMQIRRPTEIETRLVIEEVVTKAIKSYMEILQNQQAARAAEEFVAVAPIDVSTVAVDSLLNYMESARKNNAEVLLNTSNKTALSLKIRGQQAGYSPILSLNFKTEALQDEGGNSDAHTTSGIKPKAEYFLVDGGVRKARIQRS